MNFIEIHQLAEKKKWQNRFIKAYGAIDPNANMFGTNSRFIFQYIPACLYGILRMRM